MASLIRHNKYVGSKESTYGIVEAIKLQAQQFRKSHMGKASSENEQCT